MSFRNLLNEVQSENKATAFDFAITSLNMVAQFHLYHLLTKNAHHHDVLGEFYDELDEELDEFAEYFLGDNDLDGITATPYVFITTPDVPSYLASLTMYETCIAKTRSTLEEKDGALIDALNDIQEIVAKLKYKLKMN